MNILHILDHSLPMQSGYSFRTRAILKAQQARGWSISAVTGRRHKAAGSIVEEVDGLVFHRSGNGGPAWPIIREVTDVAALARAIDARVRAHRPDMLHAHSPALNGVAALAVARRHRLPLVYEIRAFWEDAAVGNGTGQQGDARYRATRALEGWVARRADAVVTICEGLRQDLLIRGLPAGKIDVVPNAVDLEMFGDPRAPDRALAAELGLNGADIIGFIGSFYPYEGLADLINAMPWLMAAHPAAALLLVGGGPEEGVLRALAAASPVAHRIHFTGRVPHDAVERYYSLIRVLAYPRRQMRLTDLVTPLKPLEAMAQGQIVAASDVGGHRELIEDGRTGALFPPGNPDSMADVLASLLSDPDRQQRLRQAGRGYVMQERNWSKTVQRYEAVYQRVCK